MSPTLTFDRTEEGTLLQITLNRPERLNAMSIEMMHELSDVLRNLETDRQTRVVVLCGAGKGFCAGADLKASASGDGGQQWDGREFRNQELFSRVIIQLARIPQVQQLLWAHIPCSRSYVLATELVRVAVWRWRWPVM